VTPETDDVDIDHDFRKPKKDPDVTRHA